MFQCVASEIIFLVPQSEIKQLCSNTQVCFRNFKTFFWFGFSEWQFCTYCRCMCNVSLETNGSSLYKVFSRFPSVYVTDQCFLGAEMKQFLSNRRRDAHMNWHESAADWEREVERCGATGWRVSSVNERFEMSTRYDGFRKNLPHLELLGFLSCLIYLYIYFLISLFWLLELEIHFSTF